VRTANGHQTDSPYPTCHFPETTREARAASGVVVGNCRPCDRSRGDDGVSMLTEQVEWLATGHVGGPVKAARALVCTVGGVVAGVVLQWDGRWTARGPCSEVNIKS
jgi:hypothetical protein